MGLSKHQHKELYDFLSSTGYIFDKTRHKRIKQILMRKAEEETQETDLETYLDNDPSILGPEDAEDGEE